MRGLVSTPLEVKNEVLEPDLVDALKDSNACKSHIFDILQEKMVTPVTSAPRTRSGSSDPNVSRPFQSSNIEGMYRGKVGFMDTWSDFMLDIQTSDGRSFSGYGNGTSPSGQESSYFVEGQISGTQVTFVVRMPGETEQLQFEGVLTGDSIRGKYWPTGPESSEQLAYLRSRGVTETPVGQLSDLEL